MSTKEPATAGNRMKINDKYFASVRMAQQAAPKDLWKISVLLFVDAFFLSWFIVARRFISTYNKLSLRSSYWYRCGCRKPWTRAFFNDVLARFAWHTAVEEDCKFHYVHAETLHTMIHRTPYNILCLINGNTCWKNWNWITPSLPPC